MLLSQRFIIRQNKIIGVEIPDECDSVTDAIVLRLCALSGGHQRMISLARCYRLTNHCLGNIHRCQGLQYLNLSYTGIENISPLMNLPMLRSLSLAGLFLINYDDIRWLTTLEILNLQSSNFSKPELLADFYLLRSLDFGGTKITSINGLDKLTRLEELYLDSTRNMPDTAISSVVQTLKHFKNLKYLQIGDSSLVKSFHSLQESLAFGITIMTKPRRIIWFENIINNNYEEVRQMILNGQDVNMRAGPEDIDLFTYYYFHKCQLKTYYFDCCSLIELYRPCASHLAIFFNSKESLELLVAAQCKRRSSVWFGKVDQIEDEVIVSDDEEEQLFYDILEEEGGEEDGNVDQAVAAQAREDKIKHLQHSKDQTKVPRRGRSGEIMPTKSWRSQSTFRKQSITQMMELGALTKQSSQQFLPPLAVSVKDKNLNTNLEPGSSGSGGGSGSGERQGRKLDERLESSRGNVIRRPTLRANSIENMKICITNDLEDFIEKVCDSGAHRFTERMIERRITGWKQACRAIADTLKPILTRTKLVTNLDENLSEIPIITTAGSADEANGFLNQPPPLLSSSSVGAVGDGAALGGPLGGPGGLGEEKEDEQNRIISRNELTSAPISINGDISLEEERSSQSQSQQQPSLSSSDHTSIPVITTTKSSTSVDYLPSVLEMSPYDTLVSKLHYQQKISVINEINPNSLTNQTITILGPKSFEGEGRRQTIRERVQQEEEKAKKFLEEHSRSYDPSKSEYFFTINHYVTREERKNMLKARIKERNEGNL